jgi:hypothetical protein
VTRRPRSKLPPKLPDNTRNHAARVERQPTLVEHLKRNHVAGRSNRFGNDELTGLMRDVVDGIPSVRLGLPRLDRIDVSQVRDAVKVAYGWEGDGERGRIAPVQTISAFTNAWERIAEVSHQGAALAFATARPASFLSLYRSLAAAAAIEGARVLTAEQTPPIDGRAQRLWWIDAVAVLTDGLQLLGTDSIEAAEELLFTLPRPDLVVADRTFAGVSVRSGIETVAFGDLDSLALAVAAWQGRALRVVPLADHRPPRAYAPLLQLIDTAQEPGTEAGFRHDSVS